MSGIENKKREIRYSVTPRATKDYNDDATTTLADNVDETTKYIEVGDATSITKGSKIYVDSELMYIESKDGNKLVVTRGYENSNIEGHVTGTPINLVTEADDDLINYGDDFGFNEETTFFQDFKEYSPSQNVDL
jgi:hypothetical protein